jgi:hypothetical protein
MSFDGTGIFVKEKPHAADHLIAAAEAASWAKPVARNAVNDIAFRRLLNAVLVSL